MRTVERVKNEGEAGVLPINDAAVKASCIIDYLIRAMDLDGKKLPEKYRSKATLVTVGARFITTASLLSWILFSLVSYQGTRNDFSKSW
jgi:hypothetical protein